MKKLKIGVERLHEYKHIFTNKRVGLLTNHTGVTDGLLSTIDILKEIANLVCLFAPEHGIRGEFGAGELLDTYEDTISKLPVYSLYGKHDTPTASMMENVDMILYDVQDIGVRYYTFIFTMAHVMSACAQHGKEFVVLDRPNPLGSKVEGNILNMDFRSLIGDYPIVQRYGLTIGELARLFNVEYGINCALTVVEMINYQPHQTMINSDRKWIFPSPNIPTVATCFYYLMTCYFEGTNISEGRGTAFPFKVFGAPFLKAEMMVAKLKEQKFKGVDFKVTYFIPSFSRFHGELNNGIPDAYKHSGKVCHGVEIFITDFSEVELVKIGLTIIKFALELHEEAVILPPYAISLKHHLDYLVGDDFIRLNSLSLSDIYEKLTIDSNKFAEIIRRYRIYE